MKRLFYLLFLMWSVFWGLAGKGRGENCFIPADFDLLTYKLHLSCVDLGIDTCFSAVLELQPGPQRLFFTLVSVNATDIPLDQIDNSTLLPFYDPDNETLTIPFVMVDDAPYKVGLKLVWVGDQIGFDLINFLPLMLPTLPVCWSDPENGNSSEPYELVFSQRLLYDNQLVECFEYKGPWEFISFVSSFPPPAPEGLVEVVHAYQPCPANFQLGCYRYDEDHNWYAMYKYSHPLADYLFPRFCPEEEGYEYIFP